MRWLDVLMDYPGPHGFENPFSLDQDGSLGRIPFSQALLAVLVWGIWSKENFQSKVGFIPVRGATFSMQLK